MKTDFFLNYNDENYRCGILFEHFNVICLFHKRLNLLFGRVAKGLVVINVYCTFTPKKAYKLIFMFLYIFSRPFLNHFLIPSINK